MRYKRVCARCGREVDVLYDNLCKKCYEELHREKRIIKKIRICKRCGAVFYGNKKVEYEKIKAFIDPNITKIEYIVCEECKKVSNRSYNMIVQIRNVEGKEIEELINILKKVGYIKKVEEISNNSIDIYLLSKTNFIKKYYSTFKRRGFKIKITRKIKRYDRQHGKPIYVLTLLLRK